MNLHHKIIRVRQFAVASVKRLLYVFVVAAVAITSAQAAFTGQYALDQFTFTQTNLNPADSIPANGTVSITPEGWLSLTGSHTGSALFPGAHTDLTIQSRGTGQVAFDWLYSSVDIPEFDIAGYLLGSDFTALADTSGQSGAVSFAVTTGTVFGFRVRTLDNEGEPGVLTIKNFTAPVDAQSAVPEPGTFVLLAAGTAALIGRRFLRAGATAGPEVRR